MIEPKGTPVDVLGVPNRQSKVPMGSGQAARNSYANAVLPQAQDHPGYGTPGTQGFSDTVPGKTRHDKCTIQAQDAGAVSGFSLGGEINKGAANTEGKTPVDVRGVATPQTKVNAPSSAPGAYLFPGIID